MLTRRLFLSLPALRLTAYQQPGRGIVIVLVGPPVSGKTTQAELIRKEYGLPIISPATMIKQSYGKKTKFIKQMEAKLAADEILDDDGMKDLLSQAIGRTDLSRGFVLEGYPITRTQAEHLGEILRQRQLRDPVSILIQVPDEVLRERAQLSGNKQNKPEIFERRLKNYRAEIGLVRSYYPGARIFEVDGTKSPEQVYAQIRTVIESNK